MLLAGSLVDEGCDCATGVPWKGSVVETIQLFAPDAFVSVHPFRFPSSKLSIRRSAGAAALNSSSSEVLEHPASAGKSMSVSPSLSIPSEHCEANGSVSSLSETLEHPVSARSTAVSPSLSIPSLHCGGLVYVGTKKVVPATSLILFARSL